MGNAPTVPRQSLHQTLAAEVCGSSKLVAAERGDGLVLEQSDERSVVEPSEVPVLPRVSSHKRRHQGRQLHQVNLASLTFFWIQCWLSTGVTQPAACMSGEAPNWARYSWVIAKAASRGSATSITHCSKTGAAAARSRLALCFSAPDTGVEAAKFDPQLSRDYSRKECGASHLRVCQPHER